MTDTVDLTYHGDAAVGPGLLDLAVNVRSEPPPGWLTEAIMAACGRLAGYPNPGPATEAIAGYHARPADQVLLTAGAAEAFGLIAQAVPCDQAVVVHPQFTEPERALRLAGRPVERLVLRPENGFVLDPALVPADADLVMLGNPTNPTGVLHPAETVAALSRPGRLLVVDEAFMDAVPGEPASFAAAATEVVVVRSLTKTWGLAGLRIGYLLGPAPLVARLRRRQVPWAVSTPALAAAEACASDQARTEAHARAVTLARTREALRERLQTRGLWCVPGSLAPFLLVRSPTGRPLTDELRARGVAVRRAETFPGLGAEWFRVAVRDESASAALLAAIDGCLTLHS